jgi:hypothetical protein
VIAVSEESSWKLNLIKEVVETLLMLPFGIIAIITSFILDFVAFLDQQPLRRIKYVVKSLLWMLKDEYTEGGLDWDSFPEEPDTKLQSGVEYFCPHDHEEENQKDDFEWNEFDSEVFSNKTGGGDTGGA